MKVIFVSVAMTIMTIGFLGIYASPGSLDREVEETAVNHLKASRAKRAPDQFARMVNCSINENHPSAWDHFNLIAYGCYCGPFSNYRNPDATEAVDEVDMCCKIHDECWYDALNNLKYTFCVDLGWFGRPCHTVRCDGRNPLLRYDFDYDTCSCNDMETGISTTDATNTDASTTVESSTRISTTTGVSTTEETTTEVSTTEEISTWVSTTGESTTTEETGYSTSEETQTRVSTTEETDEEENEEDSGYEEIEEVTDEEEDEEENEEDGGYEEIEEVADDEEEHSENVECLNALCACDTAFVACLRRANPDPDGDGEPYSPVPPCE